jgi:hypothetical protein
MKPHLEFYKKCCKDGQMEMDGLCSHFFFDEDLDCHTFELLKPIDGVGYWGFSGRNGLYNNDRDRWYEFTPLRQNIILFIAAINEEL